MLASSLAVTVAACGRDDDRDRVTPQRSPSVSTQSSTGAQARRARDSAESRHGDLDSLAVELAAANACDRLRGQFRALRAADRPAGTGTVWIRDCVASVGGDLVTFAVSGNAWQRAATGAEDLVEFSLRMGGRLGVTYQPASRVLAIQFRPDPAGTTFMVLPVRPDTAGDEAIGTAILGAVAAALAGPAHAPMLASPSIDPRQGVSATISGCDAVPVFAFGSGERIQGGDASPDAPIEIARDGLAVFGPHDADRGLDITVRARGAVQASVVCHQHAQSLVRARVDRGRPHIDVPGIVARQVTGTVRLKVPEVECPVSLVLRPLSRAGAVVRWQYPMAAGDVAVNAGPLRCTPVDPEPRINRALPARGT